MAECAGRNAYCHGRRPCPSPIVSICRISAARCILTNPNLYPSNMYLLSILSQSQGTSTSLFSAICTHWAFEHGSTTEKSTSYKVRFYYTEGCLRCIVTDVLPTLTSSSLALPLPRVCSGPEYRLHIILQYSSVNMCLRLDLSEASIYRSSIIMLM